jgi:hypothetical protein
LARIAVAVKNVAEGSSPAACIADVGLRIFEVINNHSLNGCVLASLAVAEGGAGAS